MSNRRLGAVMFLPAILYVLAVIGVPFVLAFIYSLGDVKIASVGYHFVGLENFRSVLQSPTFRRALYDSVVFTVGTQIIVLVGSTVLALALKEPFRGRGLVRFLILLPWVAPVSLGAIGWKWILDSLYSVINWVLIARYPRSCRGGWRRILAHDVPDHHPDDIADRERGGALRRDFHFH